MKKLSFKKAPMMKPVMGGRAEFGVPKMKFGKGLGVKPPATVVKK